MVGIFPKFDQLQLHSQTAHKTEFNCFCYLGCGICNDVFVIRDGAFGMLDGIWDFVFGVNSHISHISGMSDFVFGVYSHINIAAEVVEVVEDEKMA